MCEALNEAGSRCELHVFDGLEHAFDLIPEYGRLSASLMTRFLDSHVLASTSNGLMSYSPSVVGEHQTEGMSNGIEVDPEGGPRLVLVFPRADRERAGFAVVEIGYEEVEVELLGNRTRRPRGRDVVRHLLERDRWMRAVVQLDPLDVFGFDVAEGFDLEAGELRVKSWPVRWDRGNPIRPVDSGVSRHS